MESCRLIACAWFRVVENCRLIECARLYLVESYRLIERACFTWRRAAGSWKVLVLRGGELPVYSMYVFLHGGELPAYRMYVFYAKWETTDQSTVRVLRGGELPAYRMCVFYVAESCRRIRCTRFTWRRAVGL